MDLVCYRIMLKLLLAIVCFSFALFEPALAQHRVPLNCSGRLSLTEIQRTGAVTALSNGQSGRVYVDALAAKGCFAEVKRQIRELGGSILFADRRVGYISAGVPSQRLLDLFLVSGLATAGVFRWTPSPEDTSGSPSERVVAPLPSFRLPISSVAVQLPAEGPYFPAEEGGLVQLRKEHPEADGRGSRIALIDTGVDLLHPALQRVVGLSGQRAPKVVDVERVSSPEADDALVTFSKRLLAHHRKINFAGRTWTVPRNVRYRVGIFSKKIVVGALSDPARQQFTITVGVLWDPKRNLVWVDTDGDQDFADDRPLGDYSERQDIGWFGNSAGHEDNRIPFAVKIDRLRGGAYLEISGMPHGTEIASTAAANQLTGGLFDGAAPMAQLVDIDESANSTPGPLLPFAVASGRGDVDVINRSGAYARPGLPIEDHQKLILERFIRTYDKVAVCMCAVAGAVNVADYQSPEMLRRNRQAPPPHIESVHSWVWFTEDGLANTVVAPSTALMAASRYNPMNYIGSEGRTHLNGNVLESPAPAGYEIGSNPSPTISYVSGLVASVISLAKQQHVRYDAFRIRNALFTSAKLVPGFPASVQGHGLVDAAGMWRQLKAMAMADDPMNSELTSFEIGRERGGRRIAVYGYSEEFVKASNVNEERGIWVTRQGGYAAPRPYRVALRGNDGTFTLRLDAVDLPRNKAKYLPFDITPQPNLHVAFLQLIDKGTGATMQEIPLEMRAPQPMEVVAPGVERYQTEIEPRRTQFLHFTVGRKAQAVRISIAIADDGSASDRRTVSVTQPSTANVLQLSTSEAGVPVNALHHVGPMQLFETVAEGNLGGIWSLYWGNRGLPEYETPYDKPAPDVPIPATLTVSNYAVSLERTDSAHVVLHNQLAQVNGRVEFLSGKTRARTLTTSESHGFAQISSQMEADTLVWRVTVHSRRRHVSAYVFALFCTKERGCKVSRQLPMKDGEATVSISDPAPGEWRVAVLPDERATGQTYELREIALKPLGKSGDFVDVFQGAAVSIPISAPSWTEASLDNPIYAGFRIAPGPKEERGTLIALTPLSGETFR